MNLIKRFFGSAFYEKRSFVLISRQKLATKNFL